MTREAQEETLVLGCKALRLCVLAREVACILQPRVLVLRPLYLVPEDDPCASDLARTLA